MYGLQSILPGCTAAELAAARLAAQADMRAERSAAPLSTCSPAPKAEPAYRHHNGTRRLVGSNGRGEPDNRHKYDLWFHTVSNPDRRQKGCPKHG